MFLIYDSESGAAVAAAESATGADRMIAALDAQTLRPHHRGTQGAAGLLQAARMEQLRQAKFIQDAARADQPSKLRAALRRIVG